MAPRAYYRSSERCYRSYYGKDGYCGLHQRIRDALRNRQGPPFACTGCGATAGRALVSSSPATVAPMAHRFRGCGGQFVPVPR